MNNYSNMRIPATTKVSIKLFFFYLTDAIAVIGAFFIGTYIQGILKLPGTHFFVMQFLNVVFAVFCCLPTANNPGKKTIQVIFQLLKKDKNRYFSGNYRTKG
ncbi:hypothetical protein M2139_001494 [Enterococcus sp. PF1-24]|uniref:DUF5592 family protein n=1 Tax=unclassified Enterococcus TaxID=2608891 RepID=UPI00247594EF|nr:MULTISPECIES: DUF5592 family protein [unclassified Enterococcus]MDH6364515.1 hypothetical protein [Enterococcus sp. PFB1-1]MDH6401608.1 hypothetical protein [Enterococcus sp. PF1-24]